MFVKATSTFTHHAIGARQERCQTHGVWAWAITLISPERGLIPPHHSPSKPHCCLQEETMLNPWRQVRFTPFQLTISVMFPSLHLYKHILCWACNQPVSCGMLWAQQCSGMDTGVQEQVPIGASCIIQGGQRDVLTWHVCGWIWLLKCQHRAMFQPLESIQLWRTQTSSAVSCISAQSLEMRPAIIIPALLKLELPGDQGSFTSLWIPETLLPGCFLQTS